MFKNTRKRGTDAETIACDYLQKQHLILVYKNFYCRYGEIDLIMKDSHYLVFIEVRYRMNNNYMNTVETIDYKKQQKIIVTSQHFLVKNSKYKDCDIRYDALLINKQLNQPDIHWIQNAFQL